MARKVQVVIEDDMDGGLAAETVAFSLDGTSYEIDLSEANAASLREALAPWVASARSKNRRAPARPRAVRRSSDTAEIRRWATENGIPVNARGRISADVRAKYEAAHPA